MRPDFITKEHTPMLYQLAQEGVMFRNHHAVYCAATEVNGTAIATGSYPETSGLYANNDYRPSLGWMGPNATEGLDFIRRADFLTGGRYLSVPTVAELGGDPDEGERAREVAALEGAAHGITVNALCPGYVDTPLVRNQLGDLARTRNVPLERVLEEVIYPLVPMRRLLTTREIADYALFLASDRAGGVTGAAVVVDGGYTAQ